MRIISTEQKNTFVSELKKIGQEAQTSSGKADYYHMLFIRWAGKLAFVVALFACYRQWFITSSLLLSLYLMINWLLMHHIGHGGYNKIDGIQKRFHSQNYAQGWRRYIDWFDWIKPEAWNYEHNYLHHSFTGEDKDPDLVEENLNWLAKLQIPKALKFLILLLFAFTWKVTYYSARTLSFSRGMNEINFSNFFDIRNKSQRIMWLQLFVPYILVHFVMLPLLFELLFSMGQQMFYCRLAAELLHNLHTFLIIVPNHAGDDLYRYPSIERDQRGGDDYYLRQILGSTNYCCGNEWLDLSQMYLNYQIEHHLFPKLPMRQYRLIQPKVKALCEKYNIPYVQQSIWLRIWKMCEIAIGHKTMLRTR